MNEPLDAGARLSHMVLELGLGVEWLGGRRGDDRRRGRRLGASGNTSENDARDEDEQNSWTWVLLRSAGKDHLEA